jgi:hypothetical protein
MEDNQGLLNKDTNEAGADKAIAKIVILATIGIAFSFLFGYFLRLFIFNGQSDFLLFSFLAALGFLVFFLLEVFFIKNLWIVNLIIFSGVLAFSASFYDQLSKTFGIGVLISFLFLLLANQTGRQELENMLKIKFWRVSKKIAPKAIAALAVFVGIVYAGVANLNIERKEFFISQTTFEKIISPIANMGIIQRFLPGFDLSLPTGKLIENLAASQIEENLELKLLPESAKNQLINQSVKELENKIPEFTATPLDSKAKASDALYEIMIKKFGGLPTNIISIAPMIVAALIFLTIVGLSLPIRLIVTVLAFLIYEICLALGFSAIMMEGKSGEIIVLK